VTLPDGWHGAGITKESGQSWVYQVSRSGGRPIYALKRLKNPARRARFIREVSVMSRLSGEGLSCIPPVLETDLDAERPWFLMPWYDQGSLEDAITRVAYRQNLFDGLAVLAAIARCLREIHIRDLAHRDLKPPNVFLSAGGIVLGDFGLCLQVDDDAERLTGSHEAVGSWLYVAPENESGVNESVDQRPADFYAFAKLAWATLAGTKPLARERQRDIGNRLQDVLHDTRYAALDPLFDALLSTDPRTRLTDWNLVITELEAFGRLVRGEEHAQASPLKSNAFQAARRISELPEVREEIGRRSSSREREEWLQQVIAGLQGVAIAVRPQLDQLSAATGGAVKAQTATGGDSLKDLLPLHPGLLPEGLDPEKIEQDPSGGSPLLFLTQSPMGLWITTVRLGVHIAVVELNIYAMGIPYFLSSAGEHSAPDWAVNRYYRAVGPLPLYRVATLEEIAQLGAAASQDFLEMCSYFLSAVADGADPLDPARWS